VTPKLILEYAGQQQFRKKPNRTKDQRINLQCSKSRKKVSGPRIQAEGFGKLDYQEFGRHITKFKFYM